MPQRPVSSRWPSECLSSRNAEGLEAQTDWGEVTSYEIGVLRRGLRDVCKGIGFTLAKALLAESQQCVVQDQV